MAQRRGGSVAAPAKQKLRKRHGPKRKMFHCWSSTTRWHFAGHYGQTDGILNKYCNYESFSQFCATKGVRTAIADLWANFVRLPDNAAKKEFFKTIAEQEKIAIAQKEQKVKKSLSKAKK